MPGEVQRVPDLLLAVKKSVDERRRSVRFLLTGSADLRLKPAWAEPVTLAGAAAPRMLTAARDVIVLKWFEELKQRVPN